MSDVSDPEDEIVDIGPDPPKVAPASVPQHVQHGGCQARRPLNQKPPGADKWSSIYTVYLNKNRTKAQGRRVSKEIAVINPTIYEIKDILHNMGFKIYAEDKVHPRELDRFRPLGPPPFNNPFRGRIRYQLKDENGKPTNPKYQTKNDVLNYLGEMIPKLKTRIEGHKMMEQHLKQQQEEEQRQAQQAAGKSAKSSKNKPGKKGKAKKKK